MSDAIYPYNKGGKEKRLYELSTRLARLGHDVHIYTMHWWQTPEKTRLEDGVQLHAISKLHNMYHGDRRSIKEAVLFGLACFKLLFARFEILDVDHMPFFPIYSAWIVCTLRGKRLYGTWHEALSAQDWVSYMGRAGYIAALIERVSIQLPHRVIAASAHTQSRIQSELKRTRRISLIPSGIDVKNIGKIKPADIACDVLYSGRLVKDKNVDKLILAVAKIVKTNNKIRCIIIGHGIEKPHLEKMIQKLGLTEHITLLDPLPDAKDIYAYMKASKVFCLPSVREGFGIVALEALGCGTPVITVDYHANAAKAFINEAANGSVVSLKPQVLAKAIEYWVNVVKPEDIAHQVANYDWNKLVKNQTKVYAL